MAYHYVVPLIALITATLFQLFGIASQWRTSISLDQNFCR
jgi:hypothetical protein